MKFKALTSLFMAATTALSLTMTAFAENAVEETQKAYSADGDRWEEYSTTTLSIDEFADMVSEYGCSVTKGDEDVAQPQKHESGSYTFSDNEYHKIGQDTPLINEDLQIQNIKFDSNATSVDVRIDVRLGIHPTYYTKIPYGGHTETKSVPFGTQYRVYMRVNSIVPLSSSNTCTVTYYWTDRGWELI